MFRGLEVYGSGGVVFRVKGLGVLRSGRMCRFSGHLRFIGFGFPPRSG